MYCVICRYIQDFFFYSIQLPCPLWQWTGDLLTAKRPQRLPKVVLPIGVYSSIL